MLGVRDGALRIDDPASTAFLLAAALRGALEQWHCAPGDVEAHCGEAALAGQLVSRLADGAAGERPEGGVVVFDIGGASR